MLDHRQTYSPIRKTRVNLIAANLFNRIKKGLHAGDPKFLVCATWYSHYERPGVWLSDRPSSKYVQRLQLRWPVKGGRVGGTHSRGRVEYERPTGVGEQKRCTLCPVGCGHLFKCMRVILFAPPLLTLHIYCIYMQLLLIQS